MVFHEKFSSQTSTIIIIFALAFGLTLAPLGPGIQDAQAACSDTKVAFSKTTTPNATYEFFAVNRCAAQRMEAKANEASGAQGVASWIMGLLPSPYAKMAGTFVGGKSVFNYIKSKSLTKCLNSNPKSKYVKLGTINGTIASCVGINSIWAGAGSSSGF